MESPKKILTNWITLTIVYGVLLLIAVILCRRCEGPSNNNLIKSDTVRTTINHYDTIWKERKSIITLVDSYAVPVYLPNEVDTQAIISSYFQKRIYTDTIRDDTIKIVITDTVYLNKLQGRYLSYRLLQPQRIEQTTITNTTIEHNRLYLGSQVGYNQLSPTVLYSRPRWSATASYNLIQRQAVFGAYLRIGGNK